MLLINLADKTVKDFDFLRPFAVCVLGGLMDNDLFNQGIEHFGGQLGGVNTNGLSARPRLRSVLGFKLNTTAEQKIAMGKEISRLQQEAERDRRNISLGSRK